MEPSGDKLLDAACNGDTAKVKELIRKGVTKDVKDRVRFFFRDLHSLTFIKT